MRLELPIYVEERRGEGRAVQFSVRPLLFAFGEERANSLEAAERQLRKGLEKWLFREGRSLDQSSLLPALSEPAWRDKTVSLDVETREGRLSFRLLLVVVDHPLGEKLVYWPGDRELCFLLRRGEDLRARALEVYSDHLKRLARKLGEQPRYGIQRRTRAYVSWLSAETGKLDRQRPPKTAQASGPLSIAGAQVQDGFVELRSVGRCYEAGKLLAPDKLIGRDEELAALTALIELPERAPLMLVGEPGVGKTALLEAYLQGRSQRKWTPSKERPQAWLISPQRLISGMMYVGQWEQRLLAIVAYARRVGHTLVFRDLLGLFRAGVSGSSSLSVGKVLGPILAEGGLSFVGETTPEALELLRELDRPFADLFSLLPIGPLGDEDSWRVLLERQRRLEVKQRCRFALEALPEVVSLERRYTRDRALPGTAAAALERLAVRGGSGRDADGPLIDRGDVLAAFRERSGLSLDLIDTRRRLLPETLRQQISARLVGQPAAVEALVDVALRAKTRLNDPGRPLASLLFVGPTGVGKTEAAKVLAETIGDGETLLRIESGELVAPGAAARLIGSFQRPEGLLTGPVRLRPYRVVLLDEIEKAHPEVHDLLLQLMGHARLSDGRGRLVDFSGCVLILTSNLGASAASKQLGFGGEPSGGQVDAAGYERAISGFFRPELVGRIDRVVTFGTLPRDVMRQLAVRQLASLTEREGFSRRRCALVIAPAVEERLVELGYHPELGARALKRCVERELAGPLARELARLQRSVLTLVTIDVAADGAGFATAVESVHEAPPLEADPGRAALADEPAARLEQLEGCLAALAARIRERRDQPISTRSLDDEALGYLQLGEELAAARELASAAWQKVETQRIDWNLVPSMAQARARPSLYSRYDHGTHRADERSAQSLREFLSERLQAPEARAGEPDALEQLVDQLARCQAIERALLAGEAAELTLIERPLAGEEQPVCRLLPGLRELVGEPEAEIESSGGAFRMALSGVGLRALLIGEIGIHLFLGSDGALMPVSLQAEAGTARRRLVRIIGLGAPAGAGQTPPVRSTYDTASRQVWPGPPPLPVWRGWQLGALPLALEEADDA